MAATPLQWTGKELLDHATKVLAVLISFTYIVGLITVNSFLLTFGIRATTLLSAEYISAGFPLTLLFVLAGLTGAFFSRAKQKRGMKVLVLLLSLLILSLMMLYITNLADYLKTLRVTGIIFGLLLIASLVIIRDFTRRSLGDREVLVMWSAVYGLVLVALVVVFSSWYGRAVYNDILPTIGGGAGSTIAFVTDATNSVVLGKLVPMSSELQTEPLQLIRETSESYLIVLRDKTSVSIDKDLVKGVIHYQTSGWEIAPSILD